MSGFKYTDHVILWAIMSTRGKALIKAYDKSHNLSDVIYKEMGEILNYMGYEDDDKPCANSFIFDYLSNMLLDSYTNV